MLIATSCVLSCKPFVIGGSLDSEKAYGYMGFRLWKWASVDAGIFWGPLVVEVRASVYAIIC